MSYKEIKIIKPEFVSEEERKAVLLYLKTFESEGFKTEEITDDEISLKIHTFDFKNFKDKISAFLNDNEKSENSKKYIQRIFDAIDSIKSYGLRDRKRVYVDYNKERKVINRKEKEVERGVYYYANGNVYKNENADLPHEFRNKIICGDSEEVLKRLPDNCIDLVFTSPPYNFGLDYLKTRDDNKWEKYFEKLFRVFDECIRVLKYSGRIIVNIQPLFSDYIPIHHIISNYFFEKKLIWKGEILWEKNNYNCKYTAWGSWMSPSNPYLKYTWEFLEIFCKGSLKKEGEKENADIRDEEFKKWVYAKWTIAPERKMKEYGHPAMFPEELVHRVLKLFSFKNDIILDPFNGVGTTTLVAKKNNRIYLGIDISEEYCSKAEERINSLLL